MSNKTLLSDVEHINREKTYWSERDNYAWLSEKGRQDVLGLLPTVTGNVLELCSGSGMFTRILHPRCQNYTCLDISANMLSVLKADLPRIRTLEGNAEEPNLPGNSFDFVLVFAGLHHLSNVHKAVLSAHRLLRPGGKFIALEPNNCCWYRRFMMPMRKILALYTQDEIFIDPGVLQLQMSSVNFKHITTDYLTPEYNPGCLNNISKILYLLMKAVAKLYRGRINQSFFLITGQK